MEVTVAELQAQLVTAISERDQARNQCNQLRSELLVTTTPNEKKSRFLTMIPLDIRNAIYTLLLHNDVLSQRASTIDFRSYHLTPEILQTCRQIYDEASRVLYGSNKFFVDCSLSHMIFSPLARNFSKGGTIAGHFALASQIRDIPSIKRAKQLIILLQPNKYKGQDEIVKNLAYLCEMICDIPRTSIQVLIVPRGEIFRTNYMSSPTHVSRYIRMENLVLPLRILRNVSNFKLRHAEFNEVKIFHPSGDMSLSQPHSFPDGFEASLKSLVESNQPVTYVFKMYANLVAYVESFELSPRFRSQMKPSFGYGRQIHPHVIHTLKDREDSFSYDMGSGDAEDNGLNRIYDPDWKIDSPFKNHPLEEALRCASIACELQGVRTFKPYRETVLEILEPQYRRIAEASEALVKFVKEHKVPTGLLDADFNNIDIDIWFEIGEEGFRLAIMLLANYAESFARDMPDEIRKEIQVYQHTFNHNYSLLPSHRLIEQLKTLLDGGCSYVDFLVYHSDEFVQTFKSAVDELDKNYLEVRKARKALFDHDTGDWGYDIDLQLERCDEMTNWGINEPKVRPKTKWPRIREGRWR